MAVMSIALSSAPISPVQVVLCHEMLTVIDNGRARPEEYATLRAMLGELAAKHPTGVGCLAVIPRNASPPSDQARAALNQALTEASESLRCMC
jgi:hypothetical protein